MCREIVNAVSKVADAKRNVIKLLEKKWPIKSKILCNLRYGQKTPTELEVQGYDGEGRVTAWMPSKKARFGRYVKDVYFTKIVG